MNRNSKIILLSLLLLSFVFGSYRLSESPPTWIDEGMIAQLALNLERHGRMGLQTSPDALTSGAYISVGFPVTAPLAGTFKIFGEGLLQARALMLVWILFLVALFHIYVLREFGWRAALLSGFLLVTFAPLYGNGKNVLGEVPGLTLLFLFLIFLQRIEKENFAAKPYVYFASGIILGLAVATKPIFILLLGAFFIATFWRSNLLWRFDLLKFQPDRSLIFIAGVLIPLVVWFLTQFSLSDSFRDIFAFYRNPYALENVSSVMVSNFTRFFTEAAPLYTALLFGAWGVSLLLRIRKNTASVGLAEKTAFVFTALVLFFYLRTPGWYRYFFPAQIAALAYFPAALFCLVDMLGGRTPPSVRGRGSDLLKFSAAFILVGLAVFQAYQVGFNSFVAGSYGSTRTAELSAYFKDWDADKSIFVYNAPEVVVFLPREAVYYQFLEITKGVVVGQRELEQLSSGRLTANTVVTTLDESGQYPQRLFPGYRVKDRVNRYVVLENGK